MLIIVFTEVAFIFESNIVRNNISSSMKHILSVKCLQNVIKFLPFIPTHEINTRNDNGQKKLCEAVNKHINKHKKNKKDLVLFSDEGMQLTNEGVCVEIEKCWDRIYKKHNNNIPEIWNDNKKQRYIKEL